MNTSPLSAFVLLAAPAFAALPFEAQTIDSKISIGYGLAIADMDGDKQDDILLADAKEIVWYKNPGWEKTVIAKNLTLRDNVCLAARDLDGDGKAEIAAGAQWNPGETNNEAESGAVFYLMRPEKEGGAWQPVRLPHEPTVHRMHWVKTGDGKFALVVLPLHGRGNVNGTGANGVKIFAYNFPADPANAADPAAWTQTLIDESLHVTHNFDVLPAGVPGSIRGDRERLIIGGKEGLLSAMPEGDSWQTHLLTISEFGRGPAFGGAGEVRFGHGQAAQGQGPGMLAWGTGMLACIEPFHGPNLTLFVLQPDMRTWKRQVLDTSFNQGHALATGLLLDPKKPQIVAGWREPNADKQFGIKVYTEGRPKMTGGGWDRQWTSEWLGEPNTMACEDLKLADLNGDGKLDIIASGRSTKNVVIYWNRSGK